MFLDPTASHLIVTTTLGENFYLHSQSRQPKPLAKLKGVAIECISWNPSQPTASTREMLVGALDGTVHEIYIEPSSEFYRREDKYVKPVYKAQDAPISGLWTDIIAGRPDMRRVLVATPTKLLHFAGRTGRHGHEGSGSIFSKLFDSEQPTIHEVPRGPPNAPSALAVSPELSDGPPSDADSAERIFAWLSAQGVLHGKLSNSSDLTELGERIYSDSKMLQRSHLPPTRDASGRTRNSQSSVQSMILTQWHVVQLVDGRIIAANRLDGSIVHDQLVLEPGQTALGLVCDLKKNTFWLFTTQEIFEVVVTEESRDVWKILLKSQQFDAASQFAETPAQKDAVATASGDYLISKGQYNEAAAVYGRSSKAFESVALTFIEKGDQDALRRYLQTKLSLMKRSWVMQRVMLASWLIELYMAKLNSLDDTITTKAELSEGTAAVRTEDQLSTMRKEYEDFVARYKSDLDRKTAYEIISSHGREQELLYFATAVKDYNYVLSYWVQRERWEESLNVLKKQTDQDIFYKYSSVLMAHVPGETVDIMMRQSNLDAKKLIPALLNYQNVFPSVPMAKNEALRYLRFEINQSQTTDAAVHNAYISMLASSQAKDESTLLSYLQAQSYANEQLYDADFALRLCIQHSRVQSCVHIYTTMEQYTSAVALALQHSEIELAASVADRPEIGSQPLRKKLWLAIAKQVVSESSGIKQAIAFLKRCEDLIRIEDLIPFFPDFVVIDDFKEEICAALEEYSQHIDALRQEMDTSEQTSKHIKLSIRALEQRYAVVEPGERCYTCRLPLLSRQFFVFPCQHAFHSDCLGRTVLEQAGVAKSRRIRELQAEVSKGIVTGQKRERMIRELDGLLAGQCTLCGEIAIKAIDEPFVVKGKDREDEWAL